MFAIAGQWNDAVAATEAALERFGQGGLPGVLELEALRASGLGYDRALIGAFETDLPQLIAVVAPRRRGDEPAAWEPAGLAAVRGDPREIVLDLFGPACEAGRSSAGSGNLADRYAVLSLLLVDALDASEHLAAAHSRTAAGVAR